MRSRSIAAIAILASTVAAAPAGAATTGPATRVEARSYSVDARVNKTEPLLNTKVTITATVKPAAPGEAVTLQVKYDNRKAWKTIDHGRLSAASRVTFKDKVGSIRSRRYRVVKPAGDHRGAGQGTAPKVTVFGWHDLVSLGQATGSGFGVVSGGVKMNGVDYGDSLRTYPSSLPYPPNPVGSVEYNLYRHCKTFRAVVGLDDTSQSAGSAQISLSTDGIPRYSGAFTLTQSAPVAFAVTNVFRLTITASLAAGGLAAIGTPQVLCSF